MTFAASAACPVAGGLDSGAAGKAGDAGAERAKPQGNEQRRFNSRFFMAGFLAVTVSRRLTPRP